MIDWNRIRSGRVIDRLREKHPGKWRYDRDENAWIRDDGREVCAYARLAPRYDGDDDSFVTEYRWRDTHELAL